MVSDKLDVNYGLGQVRIIFFVRLGEWAEETIWLYIYIYIIQKKNYYIIWYL